MAVDVDYELDPRGNVPLRRRWSRFPGDVSEEQIGKLRAIAGKCPVHRVLIGDVEINDEVRRA